VSAPLVSEPKAYSEVEALRNHRRANFCCIFLGSPSIFESNDCKRAKHSFWSGNLVAVEKAEHCTGITPLRPAG